MEVTKLPIHPTQRFPNFFVRDPSLKQGMKEILSVRMISCRKLLSSLSTWAIYSFLTYLHYRPTDTDKQWQRWKYTTQVWIATARCLFLLEPYFGNHCTTDKWFLIIS